MIGYTWPQTVKQAGDTLASMPLSDLSSLATYMKEVHNVHLSLNIGHPQFVGNSTPTGSHAEDHLADYFVRYEGLADHSRKIHVIKNVREITGVGLKEAKDFVEGPPLAIKTDLTLSEAQAIYRKVGEAGANVTIQRMQP